MESHTLITMTRIYRASHFLKELNVSNRTELPGIQFKSQLLSKKIGLRNHMALQIALEIRVTKYAELFNLILE